MWTLLLTWVGLAAAQNALVSLLESQSDLSTLLRAINIVPGLAATLNSASDITILAPTNAAFNAIPPDTQESQSLANETVDGVSTILAYHVINGAYTSDDIGEIPIYVPTLFNSSYAIGGTSRTNVTGGQNVGLVKYDNGTVSTISAELLTSQVIEADITVGGITIHKIDTVLYIPLNASQTAVDFGLDAAAGALATTGLVAVGEIDFVSDLTLFIPTNGAFEAIGSILADASLETVSNILEYHAIVGDVLFTADLSNTSVPSASGADLTISIIDETIFVNTARVVVPNILLSNGVAHITDAVLNPDAPPVDVADLDPEADPSPAFEGASPISELGFTSEAPLAVTTIIPPAWATTVPLYSSTEAPSSTIAMATGAVASMAAAPNLALHAGMLLVGALVV